MGKIACIFGGAFDPVHTGHLQIARYCLQNFNFHSLFWVPTFRSPTGKPLTTSIEHRIKMLELSLGHQSQHILSDIEKHLQAPSYTLNTVQALKNNHPDYSQWYLLIGSDNLNTFHQWHRPSEILQEVKLIVYPRNDIKPREDAPPHERLEAPLYPVSSSSIRQRFAQGRPLEKSWLNNETANYISDHHLYIN